MSPVKLWDFGENHDETSGRATAAMPPGDAVGGAYGTVRRGPEQRERRLQRDVIGRLPLKRVDRAVEPHGEHNVIIAVRGVDASHDLCTGLL